MSVEYHLSPHVRTLLTNIAPGLVYHLWTIYVNISKGPSSQELFYRMVSGLLHTGMRPEFIEEILLLPQFKGQQVYRLTNLYEETIRRKVSADAREEYIRSAIAPVTTIRSSQPPPQSPLQPPSLSPPQPSAQPTPPQTPVQIDIDSILQQPRWLQDELIQSYKRVGCSSNQLAVLQQRIDELSANELTPADEPVGESTDAPTSEPAGEPEEKTDVSPNTVPDDLPF
jgi:hypothetical protein